MSDTELKPFQPAPPPEQEQRPKRGKRKAKEGPDKPKRRAGRPRKKLEHPLASSFDVALKRASKDTTVELILAWWDVLIELDGPTRRKALAKILA